MTTPILIALIVLSILLIVLILMQQRGAALGSAFGGDGGFYATQRGAQKTIFIITVIVFIIWVALLTFNLTTK